MSITFGPGIVISGGGNFAAGAVLANPVVTGVAVSGTTATVSFTAPPLNGHPAIQYYVATSTPGNLVGTSVTSPITVSGLSTGTSYTFAVTAVNAFGAGQTVSQDYVVSVSGTPLYSWGLNNYGQLGLGNSVYKSSPTQVGALTNWGNGSAGNNHVAEIKSDGTLWTWGNNGYGQLGLSVQTSYNSPKQVGALSNWSKVWAGYFYTTHAIKTDGTLWVWGLNQYYGLLGLGTTAISYSSPRQVGALTNWKTIAPSGAVVLALKTDGTLWSWGSGTHGALGLGNQIYYSSPKQVGSLSNWLTISAGGYVSAATKTDGTLWTWGNNQYFGALGLGNLTQYSSPRQVGALTNWLSVAVNYRSMAAIKTDGTLWAWGRNISGELGLGNITNYSSPVQVGSLSNWLQLSAGQYFRMAIKPDNSLWAWGDNTYGQLGLGNTISYSSPVQVGSLSTWILPLHLGSSFSVLSLAIIQTAPGTPTAVTATGSGTTAIISYTPAVLGNSATSYTAVSTPGSITASTSSGAITVAGLAANTTYTFQVYGSNTIGAGIWSAASNSITTPNFGSQSFTVPGTYTWVAPAGVTSVSVVAVGGGSGGMDGCGGRGSDGGDSYFYSPTVVKGGGGLHATGVSGSCALGGAYVGTGGGRGGYPSAQYGVAIGGGGAGGYSGSGGNGTSFNACNATAGTGGGGGGGGGYDGYQPASVKYAGAGGGGVGLYGLGANGSADTLGASPVGGGGGSGGSRGGTGGASGGGAGGLYGGGGGAGKCGWEGGAGGGLGYINNYTVIPGNSYTVVVGDGGNGGPTGTHGYGGKGGSGAVRIVWPGTSRQFPNTSVGTP